MLYFNEDTKLIGATELRAVVPKLIKELSNNIPIIVTKRGKPVAVLQSYEEYIKRQELIDKCEDMVLGYEAKGRDNASKKSDFVDEGVVFDQFKTQ